MTDEKVSVSVEKGENPNAPFVLKFIGTSAIQDTIVSQVLKMAVRRKGVSQPKQEEMFATSTEGSVRVTRGAFATADDATTALQLIDKTLSGLADRSIQKSDIFPGDSSIGIKLFTLDGVKQAGMQARAVAQQIAQGRK